MRVPPESQIRGKSEPGLAQIERLWKTPSLLALVSSNFAFDGVSRGYSPNLFIPPNEERSTIITVGPPRRDGITNTVEVTMRNSGALNMKGVVDQTLAGHSSLDISGTDMDLPMQWLNTIFRKDPSSRMVTRPNSQAYFERNPATALILQSTGGMLQAVKGLFQTVQVRWFNRICLNVDTATSPFWIPNVCLIDLVSSLTSSNPSSLELRFSQNPAPFFEAAGRLLGMMVCVRHLGEERGLRKFKFQAWSRADAIDTTFDEVIDPADPTSTTPTTVFDYFWRKYQIQLRYPHLPMAHTRQGEFPLELCWSAPGERYRDVLQGAETADFIQ
jgi:eukaryotic translation initiation factor 2C